MPPQFILAVTDFSRRGNIALTRAALLSALHGATLKLVYLACPGEVRPADASTRLALHALQLSQRHGIRARASNRLGFTVEDLLPEVQRADLVVWGTAPQKNLQTFFMGQPVEQLLQVAKRPVLVARREAEHDYRSLIVAIDSTQASSRLIDLSFALGESAQVELFHAVRTPNEGKRVQSAMDHDDAARQTIAQQQIGGAELIVVGKRPSSRLADFFSQSTASRILGHSNTDVLVVPHDWEPASGATAAKRLSTGELAVRRVRAGAPDPPHLPNPAAVFGGAGQV
ncbi:MAG: universal stress protein [Proteobacteria bacterium]|nr:universal stress protein [Pseudomonadota bacterium]